MGDATTPLSAAEARHLLRRTGFGALPDQVLKFTGLSRGTAVDTLLEPNPSSFRPHGRTSEDIHNSWIKYLIKCRRPIQEKLVLFWHDHFATSIVKVANASLMADQNQLLRRFCKGNFRDFVKAINTNAAMMEFLDTVRNDAEEPNENYARELQELFTLGVKDLNGQPNYAQEDIVQIARAFTGWDYNGSGEAYFRDWRHDYLADWPQRGAKVIYQTSGGFGSGGRAFAASAADEGAGEIDAVIDIIFAHTDSDGKSTVARYIAQKLLTYFAYAAPSVADIDAVISASQFDTQWEISPLIRAILVNDAFYATAATPPYTAATKKSVKWPVDYAVSTLRLLNLRLSGRDQHINHSSYTPLRDYLSDMGQVVFEPPSVFGWDWETGWISSATLLARYQLATDIVRARGHGGSAFRPERLLPIKALIASGPASAGTIVDTVTDILGVTDQLTAAERSILVTYLGGPSATLDLSDYGVRNTKLHGLFALVMQSPAYQLH